MIIIKTKRPIKNKTIKINKDTSRPWMRKIPKRTRKCFQRRYLGDFLTDSLYTEPLYQLYSKANFPAKAKIEGTCCWIARVYPFL
jgi:hypothetical protein